MRFLNGGRDSGPDSDTQFTLQRDPVEGGEQPINEQLLSGKRVGSGASSSEADGPATAEQHVSDPQQCGSSSSAHVEGSRGPAAVDARVDERRRALQASGSKREPVDQDYLQVLLDTEFGPPKFQV